MAKVNTKKLVKVEKEKTAIHDDVDSSFSVFEENGTRIFQIDTYGRSSRKIHGKISQSIQLDRTDALILIELLKSTFEIK